MRFLRRVFIVEYASRATPPEFAVRRAVHRLGFRFRLHKAETQGCPDLVLPCLPLGFPMFATSAPKDARILTVLKQGYYLRPLKL
ncbi:MAG: very short patch repair endonuclease [Ferrovibrio sp.]|nr:hypothetical protein [Ferrovibrio sp.]MCW0232561.1 very short patch repair endonuclease [Ferrovibrio sp.]